MRITLGKVVAGHVILEGEPLPDGISVTILSREPNERFEFTAEMNAEFLESLAEADRGELVPADEVLRKVRTLG
jgi:hypothetical protein